MCAHWHERAFAVGFARRSPSSLRAGDGAIMRQLPGGNSRHRRVSEVVDLALTTGAQSGVRPGRVTTARREADQVQYLRYHVDQRDGRTHLVIGRLPQQWLDRGEVAEDPVHAAGCRAVGVASSAVSLSTMVCAGALSSTALVCTACSDRHQAAPDATVSAHPAISNEKPNAPLESRTRAHRTPRSGRQSRADLTERPGAPKARALAKLRYSPSCPSITGISATLLLRTGGHRRP
jgi:hypothetical protein